MFAYGMEIRKTRKDLNMYLMQPYDDALAEILDHGVEKSSVRTGVKTLSVFGMCKRYRLDTGRAPIITRRKVWPMSVYSELLWLLEGSTSNKRLIELGCKFLDSMGGPRMGQKPWIRRRRCFRSCLWL